MKPKTKKAVIKFVKAYWDALIVLAFMSYAIFMFRDNLLVGGTLVICTLVALMKMEEIKQGSTTPHSKHKKKRGGETHGWFSG